MEKTLIGDLTLYFDADERGAAELVRRACEKSVRLIRECWNLDTPKDLRVYVLASAWLRSTFHSAPWGWRILMGLTLPLWYLRARRLWQVAGGWQQQYGRRRAVGIKTPRLLSPGDSGLGERIFIREGDRASQVQRITCHPERSEGSLLCQTEMLHFVQHDKYLPIRPAQEAAREISVTGLARPAGCVEEK